MDITSFIVKIEAKRSTDENFIQDINKSPFYLSQHYMIKHGNSIEKVKTLASRLVNTKVVTAQSVGKGKNNRERREMGYERRVEFEKTLSPFYKRFIDLAAEYNIEFWDIVARNVGTRADDSFVILDLSVFPEGLP